MFRLFRATAVTCAYSELFNSSLRRYEPTNPLDPKMMAVFICRESQPFWLLPLYNLGSRQTRLQRVQSKPAPTKSKRGVAKLGCSSGGSAARVWVNYFCEVVPFWERRKRKAPGSRAEMGSGRRNEAMSFG